LATGNAQGEVAIFHVRPAAEDQTQQISDPCSEAKFFQAYSGDMSGVNALDYSPDGTLLASAGQDGVVKVWASTEGRRSDTPLVTLSRHQGSVETVAFSPDGLGLASGGVDGLIHLWGMPGQ
jgi:WD40 repeat protein